MTNKESPEANGSKAPSGVAQAQAVEPIHTPETKPATEEELQEVENDMDAYKRSTLKWTRMMVLVYLLTAVFIGLQWKEMRSSSIDTRALAVAAKAQSQQAEEQTKKMAESIRKTDTLIEKAAEQAKATNSLGTQAKRSADLADRALDASIRNSHLNERPWLTVTNYKMSGEIEEAKEFTISFQAVNTGKTPALDMVTQSRMVVSPFVPPLPEFQEPQSTPSRSIVPPGTPSSKSVTKPWVVMPELIAPYKKKSALLYLHIIVTYKDTFGKKHWTTVCVFRPYEMPLNEFQYCEKGNEMDTEEYSQPSRPN